MTVFNLFLFLVTVAGGSLALIRRGLSDRAMQLVLAFSGAFLLAITLLHLLPESFEEQPARAGIYILLGFFIQLILQRFSHGIEHGHVHIHPTPGRSGAVTLFPIVAGLAVHALMEGFPLGFHYRQPGTDRALYLAVAAHKMPEAALVAALAASVLSKKRAWIFLICFALLTPLASVVASYFGRHYLAVSRVVIALIPIVAGAFLHIATTIFFESGTSQHKLTWRKTLAIVVGLLLGVVTMLFE